MEYSPEMFEVQKKMELNLPIAMVAEGWFLAIVFLQHFHLLDSGFVIWKELTVPVASYTY